MVSLHAFLFLLPLALHWHDKALWAIPSINQLQTDSDSDSLESKFFFHNVICDTRIISLIRLTLPSNDIRSTYFPNESLYFVQIIQSHQPAMPTLPSTKLTPGGMNAFYKDGVVALSGNFQLLTRPKSHLSCLHTIISSINAFNFCESNLAYKIFTSFTS